MIENDERSYDRPQSEETSKIPLATTNTSASRHFSAN